MKILYIDYLSPQGHINFNRIQIKALLELNHNVCCVSKEGYCDLLAIPQAVPCLAIPNHLYIGDKQRLFRFLFRIKSIQQLLFIKEHIDFSDYDAVIFAAYDPLSLFFFRIKKNTYIFNHNNINQYNNIIKRWFVRHLPSHYIHIVFDNNMQQRLVQYNIHNIKIVAHGYNAPFELSNIGLDSLSQIDKRINNNEYSIIVSPSSNSLDNNLLIQIFKNIEFNQYLTNNKILFIVKGNPIENEINNENIIFINRRLTDLEYTCLFTKSKIILLLYNENFNYRTSAVLFECFANNKPCLTSNNAVISSYIKYFEYNPYFDNIVDLQSKVSLLIGEHSETIYYTNLNELSPIYYWENIL
jgi:hypothetical protein